jgi:hypothetical protein
VSKECKIPADCEYAPAAIRGLARIAVAGDVSESDRKNALEVLYDHGFLRITKPSDAADDIVRVLNMTDDEIKYVLQGTLH